MENTSEQTAQNTRSSQDKIDEQDFYDKLYGRRHGFDQFKSPSLYVRLAAEARARTDGADALDVGCGAGDQTLELIKKGFSVTAIDLSAEAIAVAKSRVEAENFTATFLTGDAEALPIPDNSIDACVCSLVLHHFNDLEGVASEIGRVVRPGGVVVALEANAHNPFCWFFNNVAHRIRRNPGLTVNQRALTRGEITRSFEKHGFGDFEFESIISDLRRDWLGRSLGATLNFYTRATVLGLSRFLLPQIAKGNLLFAFFRRME